MGFHELEAEIKKLNLQDHAALAKRLVESLDELPQAELGALWAEEGGRRLDELEQGGAREISAKQALPSEAGHLTRLVTLHPEFHLMNAQPITNDMVLAIFEGMIAFKYSKTMRLPRVAGLCPRNMDDPWK